MYVCMYVCECTIFAPATIAPVINVNVKRNPNPNPKPNLNPYPTPNQKPNHYPHSNSLLSEISSPEQMSPEQMSDHQGVSITQHQVCNKTASFKVLCVVSTAVWIGKLDNQQGHAGTTSSC